ncbi:hypothetical protein B0H66DRAFT_636636 [Apodospora peruviana]|uniref:Calcofluor white hypersensitive protein n=1 Tax=Apodospora peruviana TaxID=516989 RepID=A0AAE0IHM4_9PEZI|nr:hypothetical protein B0H66DRAFT_636636 [Apodospora peruviana]
MSKSRVPLAIGGAAAAGVGYYLYQAGGSPRAAEKQFESDAHRASAKIKGHTPALHKTDAEHEGKKIGKEAGAKFDDAVATVNKDISIAKSEIEAKAKGAKADTLKKIDEFDRKVEEGAAKSKGYLSSWFGSK